MEMQGENSKCENLNPSAPVQLKRLILLFISFFNHYASILNSAFAFAACSTAAENSVPNVLLP